jgi:hypothetical protein
VLRDAIWKEHEQGLTALYDLSASVEQALQKLPAGWLPRSSQKVVVLHLFVRAFKTSQAVYTLFSSGFAQDAMSLLRGLTEGVIDLWFILRKPGIRGRQFADYMIIGKRDWMRRMTRAFPQWPLPPGVEQKAEADYAALLARRPNYKKLSKNWSSEGMAARAEASNCKNLYFYYVLSCQMLHADPRSVSSYLRPGVGMDDGPSMPLPGEEKTVEIAYVCLLDAFNAANEVFRWRKGDLVKRYARRFQREFGDRAKPKPGPSTQPAAPGGMTPP